jgi:hypothetical protein
MIIEEFLQLDKAPDGLVLSAAIHFSGNKPIGKTITDQILVANEFKGLRLTQVRRDAIHSLVPQRSLLLWPVGMSLTFLFLVS